MPQIRSGVGSVKTSTHVIEALHRSFNFGHIFVNGLVGYRSQQTPSLENLLCYFILGQT